MKEKIFSDLPPQAGSLDLILAQPERTVKIPKKKFLQETSPFFNGVFDSVIEHMSLSHVGSLYSYTLFPDHVGRPVKFIPCRGSLYVSSAPLGLAEYDWLNSVLVGAANVFISCSSPRCNMYVGSHLKREEFQNLLLHLMIKQMIPDFPSCNYIDCSQKENGDPDLSKEELKAIQDLGLISLHPRILHGAIKKGYSSDKGAYWFGLGFMLMPGMNTKEGCDGFDEWLKQLFIKKEEWVKKRYDSLKSFFLGPKTPRRR